MPTTNKADTCPSLSILVGTMGMDGKKKNYPEHAFGDDGRCRFCGATRKKRQRQQQNS